MEPKKLIRIFLPVEIEIAKSNRQTIYQELRDELTEKFGGLTVQSHAPTKGLWDNKIYTEKDDIIIYEIIADVLDKKYWYLLKEKLTAQLHQEKILITCADIFVL